MLLALASSRLLSMSATQLGYALSALSNRVLTPPSLASSHENNRNRSVRSYAVASPSSDNSTEGLGLPTVLTRVRQAIRGSHPLEQAKSRNAMAFGMGKHMGCDVSWTFIWRPDGAFYEEIRSRHLTYKWGFDGGADSPCWEVDPTGVSKVLQRDDRESTLLTAFLKSGCWLLPEVTEQWLDMELEDDSSSHKQLVSQYKPQVSMPPVATLVQHSGVLAAAAAQPDLADSSHQQQQDVDYIKQLGQRLLQQQQQSQHPQQQEEGAGIVSPAGDAVYLAVKLKGGKLLAHVSINRQTGQPIGYSHPLCSDTEKWRFGNWVNWSKVTRSQTDSSSNGSEVGSSNSAGDCPDVYYPQVIVHQIHQDCQHFYSTHGAVVRGNDIHRAYQMPASPRVPIDAQYLQRYPERVPIWQTAGGHILAECHINGKKAGWMVLDTGASGLVIEPSVAEQYGLPTFGDLRIAAVSGKVGTRFRRVSQLRIGSLLLSDPVMMEMKVSNLVSNFHDRVVGIAGFDVFRRCRITLPCHRTRLGLIKALGSNGKVTPYVGNIPTPADAGYTTNMSELQQQRWWEFSNYQLVQQDTADAVHAAEGGHSVAPRRSVGATAAAAISSTAVPQQQQQQHKSLSRRRKKASSSSTALQAAAGAAAAVTEAGPLQLEPTIQQRQQQQQQQQDVGVVARVPVLPRKYFFLQNALIEMLLQRPDAQGSEDGYVWQEMVMIASLPHVELEFVVPTTGKRHKSLFLLDTGAGGSEMMFHSRAAKELGLLVEGKKQPFRFVTGVSSGGVGQLFAQQGTLPEVVIRGQYGSNANLTSLMVLTDVEALYSKAGGLDISLYAAGMICIDLLNRTQTVIDYTNKRIGWKIPPKEHLEEVP